MEDPQEVVDADAGVEGDAAVEGETGESSSKRRHKPVSDATVQSWLSGYPWLEVLGRNKAGHPLVNCTLCKEHNKKSKFGGKGEEGAVCKDKSELHNHQVEMSFDFGSYLSVYTSTCLTIRHF